MRLRLVRDSVRTVRVLVYHLGFWDGQLIRFKNFKIEKIWEKGAKLENWEKMRKMGENRTKWEFRHFFQLCQRIFLVLCMQLEGNTGHILANTTYLGITYFGYIFFSFFFQIWL